MVAEKKISRKEMIKNLNDINYLKSITELSKEEKEYLLSSESGPEHVYGYQSAKYYKLSNHRGYHAFGWGTPRKTLIRQKTFSLKNIDKAKFNSIYAIKDIINSNMNIIYDQIKEWTNSIGAKEYANVVNNKSIKVYAIVAKDIEIINKRIWFLNEARKTKDRKIKEQEKQELESLKIIERDFNNRINNFIKNKNQALKVIKKLKIKFKIK